MVKDTDPVCLAPDGKRSEISIRLIEAMSLLSKDVKHRDVYDARPRQLL